MLLSQSGSCMGDTNLKNMYDIIIVGAGPAGLNAGVHLAGTGKSLLLIDKMIPWELPIPCAEGVGRLGFHEAHKNVRQSWIRQNITSACYHSPDGSMINYTDKFGGYIINRTVMQRDMADEIRASGGDLLFNVKVTGISKEHDNLRTVSLSNGLSIDAKVVIDASGPIGGFGKGEKIIGKPTDLEPAYFVWAEKVNVALDRIHIYTCSHYAPGGYVWVFPRENHSANIGIVIGKKYLGSVNLRVLLDEFLEKNFHGVEIKKRFAGSIPCHVRKDSFAVKGLIKTGDSASTVNPISRAGISEALLCGKLAARCAQRMVDAHHSWDVSRAIREYESQWEKMRGKRHSKLARVKGSLFAVPDRDYDAAAHLLSSVPQDQLTMSKIFRASLGRFPRLVWAMRHLM